MLLAIDVGNTNITCAAYNDRKLVNEWRISTSASRTAEEYGVWLSQAMALDNLKLGDIKDAIVATVVPETLFNIKGFCRRYFGVAPMVIGEAGVDLGMKPLIDNPAEAGADRLVDAVAAHAIYGGPLVVVDFGTGTTLDVVDENGNYIGGVIAPGVNLSLDALHKAAAKLPRIAVARPSRVIGKNTLECMQSGIYWGYIAMIEGLIARIRAEYGENLKVIATGGLAPLFDKGTDIIDHVDADLTLTGLVEIFYKNN
ncbi:type III pantothenate kinase [Sneathiella chungangensis]|uniref:Type III pantothenate kinase n=1 Tax=Sneathiella chungangensis TaxID=1418234 RepID=A0A845MAY6_9PROT|nr:type III pantothenate kinase [Sneathiella chungangensis]MZR21001.1 type III pantothenate kinase [Sneathiella chungangensis]